MLKYRPVIQSALLSLSWLTCASNSISPVSSSTGTLEAARGIMAAGLRTTASVLYFTLVDICVITDV